MGDIDFLGPRSSRLRRLLSEAITRLALDLSGAHVLTEAASREYAVTPSIAALAGAQVYALTRDSAYATVSEVHRQVMTVAKIAGVERSIRLLTEQSSVPPDIDIITNLGFVRPITASVLGRLSDVGVVSYMCEPWEARDEDVDIPFCTESGVPVAGLWEDFDGLNIFRSCGQLVVKMCFEAGLEVTGNRFILLSSDNFGPVIASALEANLARVHTFASATELTESLVAGADAIVIADYISDSTLLGGDLGPSVAELAKWNPDLLILQFAGKNNVPGLTEAGLRVLPARQLSSQRMALTLAHLGLLPTVLLHTAGFKVGELLWRARGGNAIPNKFRALTVPMNEVAEQLLRSQD